MRDILYYENRIKLLKSRQKDNMKIVNKLKRKLRKLKNLN